MQNDLTERIPTQIRYRLHALKILAAIEHLTVTFRCFLLKYPTLHIARAYANTRQMMTNLKHLLVTEQPLAVMLKSI